MFPWLFPASLRVSEPPACLCSSVGFWEMAFFHFQELPGQELCLDAAIDMHFSCLKLSLHLRLKIEGFRQD